MGTITWAGCRLFVPLTALAFQIGAAKAKTIEIIDLLAAASTTEAVTQVTSSVQRDLNIRLRPTFAGSSTLAKHIAAGAPAHLFLSADPNWMSYLEGRKLVTARNRVNLLSNGLVLLQRGKNMSSVNLADLVSALGNKRLIMGDPAHVPAGRYGRQALEYLGLWHTVKAQTVSGASIRNALALFSRGHGRFAIAYITDARVYPDLNIAFRFPPESHATIVYPLALIRTGVNDRAKRVFDFLQSEQARAIFANYGFTFLPLPR